MKYGGKTEFVSVFPLLLIIFSYICSDKAFKMYYSNRGIPDINMRTTISEYIRLGSRFVTALCLAGALSLASCSHKKDNADKSDKYRNEIADDIYRDSGKKPKESALYREVCSWIGTPYKYGGHSRRGTDCSGLVMEVYKNVYGMSITHHSADIYSKHCRRIKRSELKEGDLVFFSFVKSGKISHVGIYLRDGKFVHASSSRGVIVSSLGESYYRRGFVAAGRLK